MRLTLLLLAMTLLSAAVTQVQAEAAATGPIHVATYVEVGTGSVKEGIALLKQYGDATRKEAGNMRTGIGQELGRANRFVVLEIWKDQAAFDAHGKSASTTAFRDKFKSIQNAPYDERLHSGMSVADSTANAKGAVYVVSHVDVPPPRKDEVIAALNPLAEQSRKGEGNLRFDVWQQTSRPNHFTVVEAWKDQQAYDARGSALPQRTFRDTLGPMLGALYDERIYRGID
jgi:quinol monooxygenase YgiN